MKGLVKTCVLVLVILVSLLGVPSISRPGTFELVDAYWSAPLTLGALNTLVVKVRYQGTGQASSISATLTVHDVAGTDLTDTDSYPSALPQGASLELSFDLNVPSDAKSSYYDATLTIDFQKDGNPQTATINFQIGFVGEPSFSVTPDKTTLERGEVSEVVLTLSVEDAPARNLEVTVTPASAFVTVLEGNVYKEGIVEVGQSLEIPVKLIVDSTAGDSVALTVNLAYEDFSQTPSTTTLTVGFTVERKAGPHISASLSPTRVVSGRKTTIWVTVINTGSGTAKDVHAYLSPGSPGIAVLSGSSRTLGDISPGGSVRYSATVRVDREVTGTATLNLRISYFDEYGDTHTTTITLGLEVARGETPILTVKALNTSLPKGKPVNATIILMNIGGDDAVDVVVDVVSGRGLYVLSVSRFHFEELASGENATLQLSVVAEEVTESPTAVMTVRIRYYDDAGFDYADSVDLSFRIVEPGKPELVVETEDKALLPNNMNTITIKIKNEGLGLAKNVTFSLASQSLEIGAVVGPSYTRVESIAPGGFIELKYQVFIQPKVYGAIQLVASLSYSDEWGNTYSRLMTLGYKVEGAWEISVVYVKTVPHAIFPGDSFVRLVVTLVNSGDYVAKNVELNLLEGDWIRPSTAAGSRAFISYLPVGQTATITFLVDVDENAPPGNHLVIINASNQPVKFHVTVLEKARFNVRNVTLLKAYTGQRGYEIILEVENNSSSTAKDIRVEIYSPFLTGTTSTYIGTLSPSEKRLISFEVDVDDVAPVGVMPIEVKIKWVQEERSLTQYSTIYMVIEERKLPILAIAVIGLFVAAFVVIVIYIQRGSISRYIAVIRKGFQKLQK